MTDIEERLRVVEVKIDEILALLRPVSAHAQWVGGLRRTLARARLVADAPAIEDSARIESTGQS